ncbi:MAG: ornithine cyclodeaminase [Rhodospirillaceae bacterium]|nr:ornithine cyclodeaminase [Rhodospirillaceae bacterium]|tara:strand:+ start:98 stop:1201 length:1104 start_codon:yes stop_codon:yes gene_type:complete
MLIISNEIVEQTLDMQTCIDVQEAAFRGLASRASVLRPRIDVYAPSQWEDSYFRWGSTEGACNGFFASRIKSDIMSWPKNEKGEVANQSKFCVKPGTYCGLVYLFSTDNGEPLAIMNDGILQHMRVGGAAAIGAKYLSRDNSKTLGMIGSGGMACSYLEAIKCVRDIERVKVFSRNPENRNIYAKKMAAKLGIEVTPVETAHEAMKGSDIVCSCTDSMIPTFEAGWLEPGMFVVNLNDFEVGPSQINYFDVAIRQGNEKIKLPDGEGFMNAIGGGTGGYVAGSDMELERVPFKDPSEETHHLLPCFVDLVSGNVPGRTSDDQITYYENQGNNGLQFASCGGAVYLKCKEQGLGNEIPSEWFLEDIRN